MEYVNADRCNGRSRVADERFTRDKERIEKLETQQEQIMRLSIQLGEILKNHEKQLENYSARLERLEKKPAIWLDRLQSGIIATVVSGLVGFLMTRLL